VRWAVVLLAVACDRTECDRALDKICACPNVDCKSTNAPAVVGALQRCDDGEINANLGYNLPACILGAPDYCRVLGGLAADSQDLCTVDCNLESACDQEQDCHEFQYGMCDLP
jgi:hypothetical protein